VAALATFLPCYLLTITLCILLRFKNVQEPLVIVAAGVVGLLIKGGLLG
jgi:hypothetical protein